MMCSPRMSVINTHVVQGCHVESKFSQIGITKGKSGTRILEFAPNLLRLARIGINLGLFKISFQYNLPRRAKMYWKVTIESPRFVPFGANLTQDLSKFHIRDPWSDDSTEASYRNVGERDWRSGLELAAHREGDTLCFIASKWWNQSMDSKQTVKSVYW